MSSFSLPDSFFTSLEPKGLMLVTEGTNTPTCSAKKHVGIDNGDGKHVPESGTHIVTLFWSPSTKGGRQMVHQALNCFLESIDSAKSGTGEEWCGWSREQKIVELSKFRAQRYKDPTKEPLMFLTRLGSIKAPWLPGFEIPDCPSDDEEAGA